MATAIKDSLALAEHVGLISLNSATTVDVQLVKNSSDGIAQTAQDEPSQAAPGTASPDNKSEYAIDKGLVEDFAVAEDEVVSSEEEELAVSDLSSSSKRQRNKPNRYKMAKEYTGTSSKMKYFVRKPFGMSQDDFGLSGQELRRRTHILDLRCPEFEKSIEVPEIRESEFDAIRINSWPILKALAKIPSVDLGSEYGKASAPFVFWKPFTFLIESVHEVEEYVQDLREKRQNALLEKEAEAARDSSRSLLPGNSSPNLSTADANAQEAGTANLDGQNETRTASSADNPGPIAKRNLPSAKAKGREPDDLLHINDLEYYITFVKENLKEDLEKQRKFQSTETTEVAFRDLHKLFRPLPDSFVAGYFLDVLCAFQLAAAIGGAHSRSQATKSRKWGDSKSAPSESISSEPLELHLLYIDFDGKKFSPVHKSVKIEYYDDMLPIRSLPVFPYAFLSDQEKEELDSMGTKFLECADAQKSGRGFYQYYTGMALSEDNSLKEEVDSTIIIDHVLGLQYKPDWRRDFSTPSLKLEDRHNFLFSGRSADGSWSAKTGYIATTWSFNRIRRLYQDQFLSVRKQCAGSIDEAVAKLEPLKRLAGDTVIAYVLRSRRWVRLDVRSVRKIPKPDGFESLVLPEGHKEIVKALVQMHSQVSEERTIARDRKQLDLVRGKGKGLLVLLHGAPGVGKTSTAECVADYTRKPLFSITCGDIGHEPQEVAKNLEENFRLANRWGCVLLLDEADVFLAKRDRENLKRNSLVSIFLRILEYYPGILFLTTNRVGTLDEAFKSRIHMSLYFPPLDKEAYLAIWDMNLNRVNEIKPEIMVKHENIMKYAKESFDVLRWNGRQIRNAVQTALALAEFRSKTKKSKKNSSNPDKPLPTVLDRTEFKKVAKAASEFDRYLVDIYGGLDEGDLARTQQIRADTSMPRSTAIPTYAPTSASARAQASNTKRSLFAESDGSEDSQSDESDSSVAKVKKDKKKKKKDSKKKDSKKGAKESKSRSKPKKSKKKETESEPKTCSDQENSSSSSNSSSDSD